MYIVASFEFEPVTLARLDCIPTPAHEKWSTNLNLYSENAN